MKKESNSSAPFIFNALYKHRDNLLGIETNWKTEDNGGIEEFIGIDILTLNTLINMMFINPEDSHNEAPTATEIQAFMTKYPQVKACGYAVSPYRDDYRTAINEIIVDHEDVTDELRKEFIALAADADEVDTSYDLDAWWD
jgi:hypothetical protein